MSLRCGGWTVPKTSDIEESDPGTHQQKHEKRKKKARGSISRQGEYIYILYYIWYTLNWRAHSFALGWIELYNSTLKERQIHAHAGFFGFPTADVHRPPNTTVHEKPFLSSLSRSKTKKDLRNIKKKYPPPPLLCGFFHVFLCPPSNHPPSAPICARPPPFA